MSSKSRSLPDCALSGTKLAVKNKKEKPPVLNSTPFVRQYDILTNKWGA